MRSSHLIIATLVISAAAIGLHEWDELSFDVTRFAAYAAFFLNAAVGIVGLWTAHRFAWVGYLVGFSEQRAVRLSAQRAR